MITVEHLRKAFGPKVAVDGISFRVDRGEVLGFLGPNGAGKSTTMGMITGFVPPTDGRIEVGGHDVGEDPIAARRLIGYLPENAPSWADMTVEGFLGFCADVRGLSGEEKKRAIRRAMETTFLEPVLHQSVDTLSKGYRHRTCLAQAIIHDPPVLVLDEPTDGLDPNQKHEVRALIRRMGRDKAIIFSTHILEEVEAACSRAIIIDRGRIVANGTPEELKSRAPLAGAVRVRVRSLETGHLRDALAAVAPGATVETMQQSEGATTVRVTVAAGDRAGLAQRVAQRLSAEGWTVDELHTEEGRLDDVFHAITMPDGRAVRAPAEVAP